MTKLWQLITRRKRESLLLLSLSLLPLLSASGLIYLIFQYSGMIEELSYSEWMVLFILLSFPIAFSLIPNTLAGLLAGYFLGAAGLAGMLLSFSLACIWGFFLGKLAAPDLLKDLEKIWPQLPEHIARFRERNFQLVAGLRLLPAPPFAIGSLVLSWLRLPFRSYFIASIAGMLPRMALMVFAGSIAQNLEELIRNSARDYRLYLGLLVFTLAGGLMLFIQFRRIRQERRP